MTTEIDVKVPSKESYIFWLILGLATLVPGLFLFDHPVKSSDPAWGLVVVGAVLIIIGVSTDLVGDR